MSNTGIQFGRRIAPLKVTDVSQNKNIILYNEFSISAVSANITVGSEPWVIKVFGLAPSKKINVFNLFDVNEEQFTYRNQELALTKDNNTVILTLAGIYRLRTDAVLGTFVCVAHPLSAFNAKDVDSVAITNPNGPQSNKPNKYFNGEAGQLHSVDFYIGATSWVFRSYGLGESVIALMNVYGAQEEQVKENGRAVQLTDNDNSLVVHISGHYRFKFLSSAGETTAGVLCIGNPTTLTDSNDIIANGLGLGTAAYEDIDYFATAGQGALADTAIQSIVAGTGITVNIADPHNPIINATGSGASTNVSLTGYYVNADTVPLLRGMPVCLISGYWKQAKSHTPLNKVVGLFVDDEVAIGTTGRAQTAGILTQTTLEWDEVTGMVGGLVSGAYYWLSPTGVISYTPPTALGEQVARIGLALSNTDLLIDSIEIQVTL